MALVRLLALLAASVVTVAVTMLVWLPISAGLIGSVFGGVDYILAYLLLMGLSLPMSILAAASAYQFTRGWIFPCAVCRICGTEPDGMGG